MLKMTTKTFNNPKRFVRLREVINICGLSRSTIRILEISGKFPAHVQITDKLIGWDYEEIIAWCEQRKKARK
jgi:prophage regulatory protein